MSAKLNGGSVNIYQNPDRKSLEKVELLVRKDGILQPVPALSKDWMEKRTFLEYKAPQIYKPNGNEILGAKDRWLEVVENITTDFKWLLHLKFYKFWSNVLYNPTIGDCLVSCLQEFPTFHNLETFPNDPMMRESLENLRHKVFLFLARLVTSKQSKEEFITHEVHGEFLYDNFLLTVPMMFDICQLYARENPKHVERMLMTAMKLQPLYYDDLQVAANFFIKAFKMIDERFEDQQIPSASGPVLLSERGSDAVLTMGNLEELVIHILDVSSNISIFLDSFPPAKDYLNNENFVNEIVHLYGNTIPEMYKRLEPLAHKDETIARYMELKHRLDVTRVELLKIFRTLTFHRIEGILEAPNPSDVPGASEEVEKFIEFLNKAVSEREFIIDYNVSYPIETDLDLASQISQDIDPVKYNFIKKSVLAELICDRSRKWPTTNNATAPIPVAGSSQEPVTNPTLNDGPRNEATNGITSKTPKELASLISGVKDILCDLGEGFIERCLVHYNYDVATVINAVFENSLPENLKSLDRTLPYIPPDPAEASAAIDRVLGSERLNVFDNDEFDVMTRDVIDKTRVHKGKRKDKYKNFGQLINDKSHVKETSNIYEKYSMVLDEYDDEYDDTYDSHDVGPNGIDEPLEMDGRAFTTPRVLRWDEKREIEDEDEDQEDGEVEEGPSRAQNDRLNFAQDPAEMRARAEQRRLSQRGGKTAGSSAGSRGDVIGKPKGQGNDKNVLINRDRKNTNKASRANHNRRSGADFKRRQGMVP
ncbi:activating signal cointegrator 1 complex subunit 2 [Venturia canescens]|uniref:activating signal cointegrator 1 complex subunit 2 n=1 Tax=Venturia canescens TaxID=32260 RepID=UPI001C9CD43D|nr:activating signal cointegrator 1 complex subunit 2 [Venturia canescens]